MVGAEKMVVLIVVAVIIAALVWAFYQMDCDLTLLWSLKYGKKPAGK